MAFSTVPLSSCCSRPGHHGRLGYGVVALGRGRGHAASIRRRRKLVLSDGPAHPTLAPPEGPLKCIRVRRTMQKGEGRIVPAAPRGSEDLGVALQPTSKRRTPTDTNRGACLLIRSSISNTQRFMLPPIPFLLSPREYLPRTCHTLAHVVAFG